MKAFSTPRAVTLAVLAAFGSIPVAAQCVSYNPLAPQGSIFYDTWPNTQTVVCGSRSTSLETVTFNGRQYAFQVLGCGFSWFDVSGTNVTAGNSANPFGGSDADPHSNYRSRHVALLDEFPYGMLSHSSEGWVVFKVQFGGSGAISDVTAVTRHYFGDGMAVQVNRRPYGSALFRVGGRVYVVGRYLDRQTFDLRIADFGDGSTAPPLTLMSRVDVPSASSLFDVIDGPGGPYLYVYGKGGVHIYNVSNPSSPQYLGKNTDAGLAFSVLNTSDDYGPGYPHGTAVATVNVGGSTQRRLYTGAEAGVFYIYDVTNPASPQRLHRQVVPNGALSGVGLACDGKLLAYLTRVADGQPMVQYYSVAGDVVTEIPHSLNWSSAYDPAIGSEKEWDVAIVPPTAGLPNHYKVLRSYYFRAYADTVAASCLDTAPTAGVTVARTSSTGTVACTGNPTHGGAVKGFPGDAFKITNASTGQPTPTVTSITVTGIDATAGNTGYASGELVGQLVNNEVTWPSPAALYGEFQVTLTISGVATPAVQYVYLCRDPDAALAVSQYKVPGGSFQACTACSWLQGYTLRLSATGSEATPDWPASGWTVERRPTGGAYAAADAGDYAVNGDGTLDLTLNSTGDYRVTVNPAYAFDESPDNTAQLEMHSGAITATLLVTQSGQTVPAGGTALRSAVTTITGNGSCAPGQTCTFAWGGDAVAACPAIQAGATPPFVCTVAANAFSAGAKAVSLNGSASPSGDAAAASTTFTVSDCASPTAPVNASPAAGASVPAGSVQLLWNASSGTAPISYSVKNSFGTTLCGPTTGTSCTYNATGNLTWFVQASNACGSVNGASTNFTIQTSQCTAPSSPTNIEPAAGTTVPAGSVTLAWSSASGSTPITYTVKNSLGSTLCSTSSTSCLVTVNSSLTWFVQASNSCGSANSSSTSFSVGAACSAPSQPTLLSPAAGATLPAGPVTLSWTGSVGDPTITYTARNAFGATLCGPTTATSCTFNATGNTTWYVKAENSCGSANSASRQFLVSSCSAPGAAVLVSPANAFSGTGATVTLQWTAPTTGTAPFTYDVYRDASPVATCQNLTATSCQITGLALNSSPHSWYVKTENSCGSSNSETRTFTTCGQTAVPVADFTWSPTGTLTMANGYQQAQPYAGQLVTLTNTSTNGPFTDVSWYDFGVAGGVGTIKTTNTSYTWTTSGNKNVRLNVSNCFGQSAEKTKVVAIAADNRPVVADFTYSPQALTVGTPITFTAASGPAHGDPDAFEWKFSDETATRTGVSITRTFTCGGPVSLTLTSRSTTRNKTATMTAPGEITGTPLCCSATRAPQPAFDWTEKGTLTFQGMTQQQPYAGQVVHLLGSASFATATSWSWQFPGGTSTEQNPTYVFPAAGSYDIYLTAGNCFASSSPLKKTVVVAADIRPVTADFTWTPGGAAVGTTVTFTAKDGYDFGDPTTFEWSFPNGVTKSGKVVTHAFTCGGVNQVTLVAKRATTASAPSAKTVTTTGEPSCCKPPSRPVSPVPATGGTIPGGAVTLQWGRPTQGSDPLTYDVFLGSTTGVLSLLPECSNLSERVCVTNVPEGSSTWFWKVLAKNECGDTTTYPDTPTEWRFKACSASAVPDSTAFTWDKSGPIELGGVVQQQPYVGQKVRFSYSPSPTTPATTYLWTDYQVLPATNYEVPNPEIVYSSPGRKKLYLRVGNCAGTRQITQYIDIYADLRPVQARFTVDPAEPESLEPVTFTFDTGDEVGNPNEFTIDFGDGTPPLTTGELSVQHAYGCSKLYRVSVTAKRIKPGSTVSSQPQTADLQVSGYPCSASGLVVVDMVRQMQRSSGVIERGDMVLFNPTDGMMELEMSVRDKDTGVLTTGLPLPPLPPQGSMALADVAGLLGLDFSTATLWFRRAEEGADTLPVVNAWKYLEPVSGVKYGQFLPVFPVWPAADQTTTRWITGLVHNSLNSERGRYGYVSKLTFVDPTITDPNRVPWGSKKLILRLYDNQTGQLLRTDSLNLDTYGGYRHDYLNRIFHLSDGLDLKAVTVQVEVPAGVSVIVTSAMYDNATENAVVFPSQNGN